MSFWKILGGVAAGVGVVVALPVAGPIGAVTAVGAAVGAGMGGLVGAAASVVDDKEKESCRRDGESTATAKYEKQVTKLLSSLKEAEGKLQSDESYFQLIIALFAIGMATANADGEISDEEIVDLEEFVTGVGHSNLPIYVKNLIATLKNSPPTFNTAMQYVRKLNTIDLTLFESVIEVISASDGRMAPEETALLTAFRQAAA